MRKLVHAKKISLRCAKISTNKVFLEGIYIFVHLNGHQVFRTNLRQPDRKYHIFENLHAIHN